MSKLLFFTGLAILFGGIAAQAYDEFNVQHGNRTLHCVSTDSTNYEYNCKIAQSAACPVTSWYTQRGERCETDSHLYHHLGPRFHVWRYDIHTCSDGQVYEEPVYLGCK